MSKPTYEDHASMFEQALTYMAAGDAGLGESVRAFYCGYRASAEYVGDQLAAAGLAGDDLDQKLIPPLSHQLYMGDSPGSLRLVENQRLGTAEKIRLRRLGSPVGVMDPAVAVRLAELLPDGRVNYSPPEITFCRGGQWEAADRSQYKPSGRKKTVSDWRGGQWKQFEEMVCDLTVYPKMAAVSEWAVRCLWSVALSAPAAPWLIASTDATGVKEMLRMRDVPEGRSRRQALLHWVKDHWRKNRADPAVEHQVREHLRGAEECDWFGLRCRVTPSRLDAAKAESATRRGKLWRRAGGPQ